MKKGEITENMRDISKRLNREYYNQLENKNTYRQFIVDMFHHYDIACEFYSTDEICEYLIDPNMMRDYLDFFENEMTNKNFFFRVDGDYYFLTEETFDIDFVEKLLKHLSYHELLYFNKEIMNQF